MAKKFKTIYDRVRTFSDSGSPFANDYISVYDKDGKRSLEVKGKYSLYDEIQSHRDSCDLQIILKRYLNTGDESVLQRRVAYYTDVTDIPKTYADVLKLANAAREMFSVLTTEQKEAFNNNPDEFLASFGTEKYDRIFKKEEPKLESPVEKGEND